ncbi:MAG: metallophosphoesterase [Planctomycetes bacterium]|nr:metallophosphoesterase [Planctomycetota bacterium]
MMREAAKDPVEKGSAGREKGAPVGRRRFLRRLAVAAGAGAAGTLGGLAYTAYIEPSWFDVERLTIRLPGLTREADGMRLAFLSDMHVSAFVSARHVARAVEIARGFEPRLLLLGGDCLYGSTSYARPAVDAIAGVWDPARTISILGNHEYWHGDHEVVVRAFARARIPLLRNEAREVAPGLWIAGTDCAGEGRADLARALAPVPAGATAILLAHEPDFADDAAATGRIALQLSGHTHGGQVRIPFRGAVLLPPLGRKYVMGHHRIGGMQLYVTRGVGVVPPPFRLFCRPEVTLIDLRRAT